MTHQTEAERAEFEDGAWYWVEKDGWIGDPPTITPALYKAASKAWYSFAFSGIPTRQVKVLEPCRCAPAAPVPQGWPSAWRETIERAAEKVKDSCAYQLSDDLYAMLAAAPQPPEATSEGSSEVGNLIESREIVSNPGSGVTVTRLNLSEAGRAALQSKANHIADAAPLHLPKPWGYAVAGRIFIGNLPEHIKRAVAAEDMKVQNLYTEHQLLTAQRDSWHQPRNEQPQPR